MLYEVITSVFLSAIDSFLSSISDLATQGANAFLTTDLDETLQGFCSFLTSSRIAKEPQLKIVVRFGLSTNERNAQIAGLVRREWEAFPTL